MSSTRTSIATLYIILITSIIVQAAEPPAEMLQVQKLYRQQLEKIEKKHKVPLDGIPARYTSDLYTLKKKLQSKSNLDGVVAVTKEIERYRLTLEILGDAVAPIPEELKSLQEKYIAIPAKVEREKQSDVAKLTAMYIRRLKKMQDSYTKDGKIEDALAVRDEAEKVKEGVDLSLAVAEPVPEEASGVLPAALKQGLVLHYGFDKDERGKVTDKSGKGNHGKVNGAKWVKTSSAHSSMEFDGKDNLVEVQTGSQPHLRIGRKDFTISAWIMPRQLSRTQYIYSQVNGNHNWSEQPGINFLLTADSKLVLLMMGPREINVALSSPLPATAKQGRWMHLLVVADRDGDATFFIDGAKTGSKNMSRMKGIDLGSRKYFNKGDAVGAKMTIREYPYSGHFSGLIDEVMVWERALSESEVTELYKSQERSAVGVTHRGAAYRAPAPKVKRTLTPKRLGGSGTDRSMKRLGD